ncbi:DUF262 domain-containing protein [Mesorhizobium sp. M7A.F.Ca.US.006.04.2.1]|uniref:DUF262 domain-containing protein n=1 Tax=unclassified Mesorhizobium TaxID=325217 RepID=UPI000FCB3975|nr:MULTISPECIES: DUF262 domain-containing protein [unclassified Mesorhizobium]RUX78262.1 DUF262 domain-containing protein [Mesorhizobium sp. M7A.F.Ca.US.005.03.1.1]RUY18875.1 DUF262 domain-containing protein [Mesorhizobium sp. M7A.F.Ca.US.005.03.2.1]RUY32199.1 DUF262 domain-containing protein [Mesorhizobium sp. M7A.F.Ca.US.001.04.2.1]RUY43295.1 DUF262 domain-containing protein [Mesorhizobium sp. M7A.F.Ca.US.001.04.1.1]RVA95448.1 DUF262 domain-containing protein [Mesorhizobium sp. M7A.F.Ca.US.0
MIKSVNNYPISQLFDIEASVVYAVPRYQREYTWGKNQWETIFDDVQENDGGYFLGSIICINQTNDSLDVQRLEVIDGQQRLTTLSLLFAAIYQSLKSREQALNDDQKIEMLNLKRKLVLKKGVDQLRVIPQIQNLNLNDYRAVLSELGAVSPFDAPPYAGNRKIFRAYRYFQTRIEETANISADPLVSILELLDKVSQACLVKIEVASHADAYTLFESLNNRGMPLTAIDLIKNKLLARAEATSSDKVDYYFDVWSTLLSHLGDDYSVQERFFRHYYNAFKDDLNRPFRSDKDKRKDPLGPVATRTNLIQIYEKLINQDAGAQLQGIRSAAESYALMLSRNQNSALSVLDKPLKDLERIQGAPSHLLLLYLIVKQSELGLQPSHLDKIARLLTRFFVRRNLTDTPPTRDLTRLFMSIIEKVAPLRGDRVVDAAIEDLLAVSASDKVFEEKLEGPIYEENVGVTRFVLCALAEEGMTRETTVDLWRVDNKQYVWSIEHIFPQGQNVPPYWVDMMAGGDAAVAKALIQSHAHRIGNLTISGFNSALGNKGFSEKRDRVDSKGLPVGYKNGLKLNDVLGSADSWSVKQIEDRTAVLVGRVLSIFAIADK